MTLDSVTRTVLRHRAFVIAAWLALTVVGAFAGSALPDRLTALTSVPGSSSATAETLLASHFGDRSDGTFIVIVPFGQADAAGIRAMETGLTDAVVAVPTASVLEQRAIGGVLYGVIGTNLALLDASRATDALRAALRAHRLDHAIVTGAPALEHDVRPVLAEDLQRGTGVAVCAALLLLLLVLGRSRAIVVPLLVAGAVVCTSLLAVFAVTLWTPMVLYLPNIVELIGLGLAIDYALLLLHRFRAEVATAGDLNDAIVRTQSTAGRTVVVSGITASVGLSVLLFTPVPFVRSLGAASLIVPIVSVLAALTLQPVLFALLGRDGVTPVGWSGTLASPAVDARWARIAGVVTRRPRATATVTIALLLVAAAPVLTMRLSPASLAAVPPSLESARGVAFLDAHIGAGAATPHTVLVDTGAPGAATSPAGEAARARLAMALTHIPGVFAVVSDTSTPFIDGIQQDQRLIVLGRDGFADPGTQRLIERLRAIDPRTYGYAPHASIAVAGAAVRGFDFLDRIVRAVPWIVIVSLLIAYLVMARAFRSRIVPAITVVLNLVSVAATLGIVALVFHGILGEPTIEAWAMVFLFAMLFGLSMDYQVFMVSHMRELVSQGLRPADAVAQGMARTAGLITAAAAILVSALLGLIIGHITGLQELGLGLAVGILIDATVVRTLLSPSVLTIIGDRAW